MRRTAGTGGDVPRRTTDSAGRWLRRVGAPSPRAQGVSDVQLVPTGWRAGFAIAPNPQHGLAAMVPQNRIAGVARGGSHGEPRARGSDCSAYNRNGAGVAMRRARARVAMSGRTDGAGVASAEREPGGGGGRAMFQVETRWRSHGSRCCRNRRPRARGKVDGDCAGEGRVTMRLNGVQG